jgi:hypothetical protein
VDAKLKEAGRNKIGSGSFERKHLNHSKDSGYFSVVVLNP